jgi:dCTP deaminase
MTVLSYQSLKGLIMGAHPMINISGFSDDLLQPASIDCPIGNRAYRMPAASVPRATESIADMLRDLRRYEFDLRDAKEEGGTYLERGVCHIIPLEVELDLSKELYAGFSPKSTAGRNDVFVRVLTDNHSRYDVSKRGYQGKLYLEVTARSPSARVSPGLCLTQMRLKTHEEVLNNAELARLHAEFGILRDVEGNPLPHGALKIQQDSVFLHVDLANQVVGLEALPCPELEVSLAIKDAHDPVEFWNPLRPRKSGAVYLVPEQFYLLRTSEYMIIPPDYCGVMKEYDVASGEFRSHYAGFFDNGFGGKNGTVGVLEVRVRDIPQRFLDGQPVCRFVFEKTDERPEKLYGRDVGSYVERGPSLGKNFKFRHEAWDAKFWKERW